jgi:methylisocitrate lyase
MNKAALDFYETVRREGTQKNIIDTLQTRAELYDYLGYHAYEDKLDQLFAQKTSTGRTHEHEQALPKARSPSR